MTNQKLKPCQQIAATHFVEPVLTTAQIAKRLGKSQKTIRNWLQIGVDTPHAYKDQNKWFVPLSKYLAWEAASQ